VLGNCAPQSVLVGADEVIEQDTIAAVHESVVGTFRTRLVVRLESVMRLKADIGE
jgi:hypothetical protein